LQSQPERIEDLRIPAVKGLPDDIYHMLHHSFVEIADMRRSIERVEAQIWQSREAILESREMLERLRRGHFCYAWHGTRGLPGLRMARLWRSSQPQRPVSIDCAADLTPGSKSRARPVMWPPRVAAKRHGVDIVYSSSDRTMAREP